MHIWWPNSHLLAGLLIFHISLQVLFHQFKYFLNLYFLLVALSQFVPALRIGYLYTYWGPLVSWRFFVSVCVCQSVSVTVSVMCSRVRLVLFGVCVSQSVCLFVCPSVCLSVSQSISQSVKCRIYQCKVSVDMLNAVKSELADVSSIRPSSEKKGCVSADVFHTAFCCNEKKAFCLIPQQQFVWYQGYLCKAKAKAREI